MTNTDIQALANTLAATLERETILDRRHGIIDAKDAIADLIYADGKGHQQWAIFEKTWRDAMSS